jgi:hypothetical protein
MYDSVYESMVEAGVAIRLDEEAMYDREGNLVDSKERMYGRPTKYHITRPENVLFVDETGCNTNQKSDGLVGGERFVVPADNTGIGCVGSVTDIHFTVMCFTSGMGEPVMCSVIFKSEKKVSEIPLNWKTGIDITKDIKQGTSPLHTLFLNSVEGGAMQGGPTCCFNQKVVPCFLGTSPNASITTKLLMEMLQFIDRHGVHDRSDGHLPFLLLDGHHSRLGVQFLDYICNPLHRWVVCIGVPYGTHLWQVADSAELNGSFKIALTRQNGSTLSTRIPTKQRSRQLTLFH